MKTLLFIDFFYEPQIQRFQNKQLLPPNTNGSYYFRSLVNQHKYPVVFSHNDMQEGNILLRLNTAKPELVLIDFEYCSYNYRGFDIANHFVEWQYDYTRQDYPFYYERSGTRPTKEQKVSHVTGGRGRVGVLNVLVVSH